MKDTKGMDENSAHGFTEGSEIFIDGDFNDSYEASIQRSKYKNKKTGMDEEIPDGHNEDESIEEMDAKFSEAAKKIIQGTAAQNLTVVNKALQAELQSLRDQLKTNENIIQMITKYNVMKDDEVIELRDQLKQREGTDFETNLYVTLLRNEIKELKEALSRFQVNK
jgi:hypothetical protein